MGEKKELEYFVLRYAPNILNDEFVNFGVVMVERGGEANGFAEVRLTQNWRRLLCADADADVEVLSAFGRELGETVKHAEGREYFLTKLQAWCSNGIQLSPVMACQSEDPARELEALAQAYLAGLRREPRDKMAGRPQIVGKMRQAFADAGVLELLLREIAVARYTAPGDPLRIDFGYRVQGELKMFHAVSLRKSVDAGVMLALKYPQVAEGMKRDERVQARLTAVVEDDLDMGRSDVQYAFELLKRQSVEVESVGAMPGLAERARRELKA